MKKLLDFDPFTGTATYWHDDPENKGFALETVQDVESVVKMNKARQNDGTNGYTPSRDMKHVATVPMVMIEGWAREAGVSLNDSKALGEVIKRKLNDPDFRAFRTSLGVV